MKAVLNVQNMVYCEIEVEDLPVPPSMNLIDTIELHDGMGIAAPTLTLHLLDQTGHLLSDLALVNGTKCTLTLAKRSDKDRPKKRKYRLWGAKRARNSQGPMVIMVFILDAPKWTTGVYCESFRTSSSDAMQRSVQSAALRYDGPKGATDDTMNWLNINQTRSAFTEDLAMRGWKDPSSCMYRVLTMDSVVRYKNMFDILRDDATATLCKSYPSEGQKNPVPIRESQDMTNSGILSHFVTYGQNNHNHSLDIHGQHDHLDVQAPSMGGGSFPLHSDVKSAISDAQAGGRVTYTGWDPGTGEGQENNLHEEYERAYYQNVRLLSLFSERMRVLTDEFTDISSFDCIDYKQKDPAGDEYDDNKALNGKYVVAGKTIRIKNGHHYVEMFDIIRPYNFESGASATEGAADSGKKAKANAGKFDLAKDRAKELEAKPANPVPPKSTKKADAKPFMEEALVLFTALVEFSEAVPKVPDTPLGSPGSLTPSSPSIVAQKKVLDSIAALTSTDNPVGNSIKDSRKDFDPSSNMTVKKISSTAVESSANSTIEAMKAAKAEGNPVNGVEGLDRATQDEIAVEVEKPVLDRFSASTANGGAEVKGPIFTSVVTSTTAAEKGAVPGTFVGDTQKGGVFEQDFVDKGVEVPEVPDVKEVAATEQAEKEGMNFVFPASTFGLGAEDIVITPATVADFVIDFLENGADDPKQFMKDQGPEAYEAAYGESPPDTAEDFAKDSLKPMATEVVQTYAKDETLAGDPKVKQAGADNIEDAIEGEDATALVSADLVKTVVLSDDGEEPEFGTEEVTETKLDDPFFKLDTSEDKAVIGGVDAGYDTDQAFDNASDIVQGDKTSNGYSNVFKFTYGESNVTPLVEKVASSERGDGDGNIEIIKTTRDVVPWSDFTKMGSSVAEQEKIDNPSAETPEWKSPSGAPYEKYDTTGGKGHDLTDEVGVPEWSSGFSGPTQIA